MKARIVANTILNVKEKNTVEDMNEQKNISGKMAAICYMKDDYDKINNEDPEKSINRFNRVVATGHHSISDHTNFTVVFEQIPKMTAMILNSLQYYATSEKSGRYTIMTASSKKEQELYDKWKDIFFKVIKEEYCNKFDDKQIMKLSQENARYVLSVFTPSTTMAYTTTIRQWTYIVDWCNKCILKYNKRKERYYKDLYKCITDLKDTIVALNLYIPELSDTKDRSFDLLLARDNCMISYIFNTEHFGATYDTTYKGSFVQLAQAQRHRTIKYLMYYNPICNVEFYIPPIIEKDEDLKLEWEKDLYTVVDLTPQATLIDIHETGTMDAFILKCKERLCGRAQLEIMKQTKDTLESYYYTLPKSHRHLLSEFMSDDVVKTKCRSVKCKEPCIWGINGLNRNI